MHEDSWRCSIAAAIGLAAKKVLAVGSAVGRQSLRVQPGPHPKTRALLRHWYRIPACACEACKRWPGATACVSSRDRVNAVPPQHRSAASAPTRQFPSPWHDPAVDVAKLAVPEPPCADRHATGPSARQAGMGNPAPIRERAAALINGGHARRSRKLTGQRTPGRTGRSYITGSVNPSCKPGGPRPPGRPGLALRRTARHEFCLPTIRARPAAILFSAAGARATIYGLAVNLDHSAGDRGGRCGVASNRTCRARPHWPSCHGAPRRLPDTVGARALVRLTSRRPLSAQPLSSGCAACVGRHYTGMKSCRNLTGGPGPPRGPQIAPQPRELLGVHAARCPFKPQRRDSL